MKQNLLFLAAATLVSGLGISSLAETRFRSLDDPSSKPGLKVERRKIAENSPGAFHLRKGHPSVIQGLRRNNPSFEIPSQRKLDLQRRVASSQKKLRGAMIDNSLWYTSEPQYGIYELSTQVGEPEYEAVVLDPKLYVMDAVYTGSVYWTSYAEEDPFTFQPTSMTYYTYNPETWEVINEQVGDLNLSFITSAWSPTDEMAYVTYDMATGKKFGAFLVEDGTLIAIGNTDKRMTALACHDNGTLYGIDSDGYLVIINPETGKNISTIGYTGAASYWRTSGAIDSENNIFYYIECGSSKTSVWAIDLETAEGVKLYDLSNTEELIGLYVVSDSTDPQSPALPTDVELNFEGASLSGSLSFNVPTLFYDGTQGVGTISYSVVIDEEETITAETSWGANVNIPLSFEEPGNHTISVTLSNDHGNSKPVTISGWIGSDIPKGVTDTSISWKDGVFTVKWSAPQESENGGYFDPESLRYTVVRMPDNITVAEQIAETEISDEVAEPVNQIKGYTYKITVYADGVEGETVTTSKKSIGYLVPPYSNSFDSSDDISGYTAVDANGDGKKWGYNTSSQAFRIQYNSSKAMDDWLFSPEFQLEAGHSYTFSFKSKAHNNTNPERIEAGIATAAKASAVVEMIVPSTDIVTNEYVTLSGIFTPSETGRYRLGLHGISDKDRYYLYADDIEVSEGASGTTPAGVTDFTVIPAADGSLKAEISFKAPLNNLNGETLSSIEKIELKRNESLIHTFDSPAPGQELTYTDSEAPARNVIYSVTAFNEDGKGITLHNSVFIGFDAPKPISGLSVGIGENTGQALLTWTPSTEDLNGKQLQGSDVTYTVFRNVGNESRIIAEGLSVTSYTDQYLGADEDQEFVSYSVAGVTAGGTSGTVTSALIPLGRPYTLPFNESFANGRVTYDWGLDSSNPAAGWLLGQDTSIDDIDSEDDDNGLAILQGLTAQSWASLISGSIAIPADGNSVLTFAYYNYATSNFIEIYGMETGAEEAYLLGKYIMSASEPEGWKRVSINLDDFKGENIQLIIKATIIDSTVVVIDNIEIATRFAEDLSLLSVSLPARVNPGSDFEISAKVLNSGLQRVDNFTVSLFVDGTETEISDPISLESNAKTDVIFNRSLNAGDNEVAQYYVKVNFSSDMNPDDNMSETFTQLLVWPEMPTPDGLTATSDDNGNITLGWLAPDLSVQPMAAVTDDLEEYTPFSTGLAGTQVYDDYVGDWAIVDRDGITPYDITVGGEVVRYPNSGRPIGFMLLDPSIFNTPEVWNTHSGDKMFVSFAVQQGSNDDWLISPRLDGSAQEISFFARSLTPLYGLESFQVYYSSTDTKITSFSRLMSEEETPDEWTEYKVQLPEGARYFAIRCVSQNTFAFLVDDITFVPAHPFEGLELIGYNVYRDNEKVNTEALVTEAYIDSEVSEGKHFYNVSAIFNRGESRLSDSADIEITGVSAPMISSNVKIYGDKVIISNPELKKIRIDSVTGLQILSEEGKQTLEVSLESGIYVVTIGDSIYKVRIK